MSTPTRPWSAILASCLIVCTANTSCTLRAALEASHTEDVGVTTPRDMSFGDQAPRSDDGEVDQGEIDRRPVVCPVGQSTAPLTLDPPGEEIIAVSAVAMPDAFTFAIAVVTEAGISLHRLNGEGVLDQREMPLAYKMAEMMNAAGELSVRVQPDSIDSIDLVLDPMYADTLSLFFSTTHRDRSPPTGLSSLVRTVQYLEIDRISLDVYLQNLPSRPIVKMQSALAEDDELLDIATAYAFPDYLLLAARQGSELSAWGLLTPLFGSNDEVLPLSLDAQHDAEACRRSPAGSPIAIGAGNQASELRLAWLDVDQDMLCVRTVARMANGLISNDDMLEAVGLDADDARRQIAMIEGTVLYVGDDSDLRWHSFAPDNEGDQGTLRSNPGGVAAPQAIRPPTSAPTDPVLLTWWEARTLRSASVSLPPEPGMLRRSTTFAEEVEPGHRHVLTATSEQALLVTYAPSGARTLLLYPLDLQGRPRCVPAAP